MCIYKYIYVYVDHICIKNKSKCVYARIHTYVYMHLYVLIDIHLYSSRRQKLFLMSTWLEDLLPNPAQGRSWMFNSICDTLTITTTIGRFVISFFMMLISPATQSFSMKERNQNSDSTSQ
jgi:hypothetical protein